MNINWNAVEEIGHRAVALVAAYACGFVTCLLTVCEQCGHF